ncbi:MAG: hypothetical protein PHX08_18665 [Lachnospiraceae bacterium]|nr:hypothetical protein [Lachnospiraceae bacterium]
MNFKSRINQFMQGRYGLDQFGKLTVGVALACWIISIFTKSSIFNMVAVVLIVYCYFRMFSRNHAKRYAENQFYLKISYKVRSYIQSRKNYVKQLKTHHIYKCPTCKQKIRVPRGKGAISIHCPKCHTDFIKKS